MDSAILKKLVMAAMVILTGLAAQASLPLYPYEGVFAAGENGSLSYAVNGAGKTEAANTIKVRLSAHGDIWYLIIYCYDGYSECDYHSHHGFDDAEYSDEILIVAIPNTGYKFKEWNDGNTDNPRVASVVVDEAKYFSGEENLSVNVTAIFEPQTSLITSRGHTARNTVPCITIHNRMLTVKPSSHGTATQVRLIDLRGKSVARFTADRTTSFSLANLPAGRYFAEIREGAKRERVSVIVGF
ncbi:MAG: T9SS type A sorting domain-containing protein [Treponema sp.]|nr:T9SS type A sorting domain-containing protein [Treponema sp.]